MWRYLLKPKIFIPLIAVAGIALAIGFGRRSNTPDKSLVAAKRGTVVQEVSVTGSLVPAEAVDLAFERTGKIEKVLVKVGDEVRAGETLVFLSNQDLRAQVLQAEAAWEAEKANLDSLRKGTRPEELLAAETKVENAQANLSAVQAKAAADLDTAYDAALTAAQEGAAVGKAALLTLTDIQYAHFTGPTQEEQRLSQAKTVAVGALLGAADGGYLNNGTLSLLTGGAYGEIQQALGNRTPQQIEQGVAHVLSALLKVSSALNAVPVNFLLTSTEKTNLATEKNSVNSETTTLSAKDQGIPSQKALNASNLSSAQSALRTAEDELNLKRAGSTPEQISAQEARVKAALGSLQSAQAALGKTLLTSPVAGTVAKQEAKLGELVTANTAVLSVVSDGQFAIEANVPETDIVKIELGDRARVVLDAYGSEVGFAAAVVGMDQTATLVEGVPTYKVVIRFADADPRIRSGMTANVEILTETREGVVSIPARLVLERGDKRFVKKLVGDRVEEVEIKTGLLGSDGSLEVTAGLNEGDRVLR